jgi:hypothetical protein
MVWSLEWKTGRTDATPRAGNVHTPENPKLRAFDWLPVESRLSSFLFASPVPSSKEGNSAKFRPTFLISNSSFRNVSGDTGITSSTTSEELISEQNLSKALELLVMHEVIIVSPRSMDLFRIF